MSNDMNLPGLLRSFGDISQDWHRMQRPYISVFYLDSESEYYREHGMIFAAKLYDGPNYTGYHRMAKDVSEIFDDIEEHHPELKKEPPGAADPEGLLCVFM